jgi:hypothetical protein
MTSSTRQSQADGEPGAPYPDAAWMTAFAERLLELKPESTPLDAVKLAMQQYEPSVALGPASAAEVYAKEASAGESRFD